MNFIIRLIQRIIIVIVAVLLIWFVTTQVFVRLDQQIHLFGAMILTYVFSAYILLPPTIHIMAVLMRKGRVPRYTRATDGLPADPVNIVFFGNKDQLVKAFEQAGWSMSDRLTLKTAWKMMIAFLRNKTYLTAPFSPLYVFARPQDLGFEEPISRGPRQRHHIRFWAANADKDISLDIEDIAFWTHRQKVDMSKPVMWVGAGTKDIGFGFTSLTYQLSHRIEKEVDHERDYIISELSAVNSIKNTRLIESDQPVIGRYITDGKIAVADLS